MTMLEPDALDRMRMLPCNAKSMAAAPFLNYKETGKIIQSFIDPTAILGTDSIAWHYSVILARVIIGARCSIGARTEIGAGTTIGDGTRIGSGVFLPSNSRIGVGVFIGPNVTCTDDRHPRAGNADYTAEPPIVGDGASIGAGAVILPGIEIGAHARVAAGAVVTGNVPALSCVAGIPARGRPMPNAWVPAITEAQWAEWVASLSPESLASPMIEDVLGAKALYVRSAP